jgi:D-beta-D-heptose 7-phosphate kinase/D-beta-D-heptose 1-phosphate adenosyltransferase
MATLGGAANVAANLKALGADVVLLAAVGKDSAAGELRGLLARDGIEAALVECQDRRTTVKTRVMVGAHHVVRFDVEDSGPLDIATELAFLDQYAALGAFDAIVLSDYAKGVLTNRLCAQLCAAAATKGIPVIVDPKARDLSKYAGATVITPNRREASDATGIAIKTPAEAEIAATAIRSDFGIAACIVTLSELGMLIVDANGATHQPTQAVEVFDVTGAGDTAVAAIAVALAHGFTPHEAGVIANTAAGLSVARIGANAVTLSELERAAGPYSSSPRHNKIVGMEDVARLASQCRASGKRIVFTNGCFDVLHVGHTNYLRQAAVLGDVLFVGVNSNESVRRLKGEGRPVVDETDRLSILAALEAVSFVSLFYDDTPQRIIESISPDVLVKGADYAVESIVGAEWVRAHGGTVITIPLTTGRSTSSILAKIRSAKCS